MIRQSLGSLSPGVRTALLIAVAMICFAANSLLCRFALAPRLVDPATFSTVRVVAAATVLTGIVLMRSGRWPRIRLANWRAIAAMFGYIVFFSFAYTRLSAGTGALILFGTVQFTMFAVALYRGERLPPLSWCALAVAVSGLIYLVLPGVTAPDPRGAASMAVAGIAWGLFSLLARGFSDPVDANADIFAGCIPLVAAVSLGFAGEFHATAAGLGLAVASGAIASGFGYVIWYAALRGLPRTHAATVQLSVPAIAAFGGVALLSEPVTARLAIASVALLGGVAVVVIGRNTTASAAAAAPPQAPDKDS